MGNCCSDPTGQNDTVSSKAAEPMSKWPDDIDSEVLTKDIADVQFGLEKSKIKESQPEDLTIMDGKDGHELETGEAGLEDDIDITLPHTSAYNLMKRAKSMSNIQTKFNLVA